jgi:hypothetical protein
VALTAISLQTAITSALAKSVDITAACITAFGGPHRVSAGGTGRQGQSNFPAFAVAVWSRSAGEGDAERAIELSILLSITDDTITTTTEDVDIAEGEDPPNVIEVEVDTYNGPEKLEALLELAAAEVLALSPEVTIRDLNYSFEPLEFFPLFVGGLDFTVTFPVLIGGYEPTIS